MRRKIKRKTLRSTIETTATVPPAERTRADELIANIRAFGDRPVIGAEVGVCEAETSIQILSQCQNVTLYIVDRWKQVDENGLSQDAHDKREKKARARLARYILEGRAKIIKAETTEASKKIKAKSLDFAFIDACHEYDAVSADLDAWESKIKPGGFIAGHDYGRDKFPGVKKAWDERFKISATGSDDTVFVDMPLKKIRVATIIFDYPGTSIYSDVVAAWESSVKENMPNAEIEIIRLTPPEPSDDERRTRYISNRLKSEAWKKLVSETTDDIILMDCDMLVLRDLSVMFTNDFDIAFTHRYGSLISQNCQEYINTGVIALRPTEKTKTFFELLSKTVDFLFENPEIHFDFWKRYRGIQQSALGYLMETLDEIDANIKLFPCQNYNVCPNEYRTMGSETRVLHLQNSIRQRICNNDGKRTAQLQLYHKYAGVTE